MPMVSDDTLQNIETVLNKLSASGYEPIITLLGEYAEYICEKTSVNSFDCIENPVQEAGLLPSLDTAINRLPDAVRGFIMVFTNNAEIEQQTFNNLLQHALRFPDNIIVPLYKGQRGQPVYFGRPFFQSLLQMKQLSDPANMIRRHSQYLNYLPVQDESVLLAAPIKWTSDRYLH